MLPNSNQCVLAWCSMTKNLAVLALRKHIRHLLIPINRESRHSGYEFFASGFCKVASQTLTSVASTEASLGRICTRAWSSGFSPTVDWWPPLTPSGGPQTCGVPPPEHWFCQGQQERVIYVRQMPGILTGKVRSCHPCLILLKIKLQVPHMQEKKIIASHEHKEMRL